MDGLTLCASHRHGLLSTHTTSPLARLLARSLARSLPPLQQDIGGFDTATSASLYPTLKCLDFPPPPPPRPPQSPRPGQLVPPPSQGVPSQQLQSPSPPPPMVVPLSGKLVQFPVESTDSALDSWALRLQQSSSAPMQDLLLLHLAAVAPLPLQFAPGNKVGLLACT